jgi:hypothetical protein
VIEPILERTFIFDSYANRKGKGTHKALDRCHCFVRRYPYVLQCDVRRFFPSLDHDILYEILARKIHNKQVLWLIHRILKSGVGILTEEYDMVYFPGDDLFAWHRARGLPIGNLTSQFWANCYLNPFDHFVKRQLRCKAYLRYVDDFLLFAHTKKQLWEWKKQIIRYLRKVRLILHNGVHPRPVTEGIPFLGFILFPDQRRLKRRNALNFSRRFRRLILDYFDGKMAPDQLYASARGWMAHASYGNTIGLQKAVLADLRDRFQQKRLKV